MNGFRICLLAISMCFGTGVMASQDPASGKDKAEVKPVPEPTAFVTQHSAQLNGKKVDFTVTAGETAAS